MGERQREDGGVMGRETEGRWRSDGERDRVKMEE